MFAVNFVVSVWVTNDLLQSHGGAGQGRVRCSPRLGVHGQSSVLAQGLNEIPEVSS